MLKRAHSILKQTFGYESFRPLQEEIIQNIIKGRDTLAIMPTGGGKSLCYQIPALIFEGLTVVVSPLISLMKDQVEQLHELGVNAAFLNSTVSPRNYQVTIDQIYENKIQLLYVAPETLLLDRTLKILEKIQLDCITIDEAHCISEWGHDFRPEYRKLIDVRNKFPKAVCAAFTATATKRVQVDIKESLNFQTSNEFIASFNRENLFLEITDKEDAYHQTISFLKRFSDQSGIIYCTTRKQVDELNKWLNEDGFSAKPYHAGLTDRERKKNQELFIRDDIQIMIATIAFGMGINKSNIRFIIHYDLPSNIESYYQQIGRAGRDGLNAHCLLLFSYADTQKINYFIQQKHGNEKRIARLHLDAMISYAESELCRRVPLITYFGEDYSKSECSMCDNCLSQDHETQDVTIETQKFLSCVKRTDEKFGANHIIDILRGSQSQKIKKFDHHKLSTYGIGIELSRKQWTYLSRQLIQKKIVHQDLKYGGLKITSEGYQILKGEAQLHIKTHKIQDKQAEITVTIEDYDKDLFQILKNKRKELADKQNVPPYVIFSDRTLTEIASYYPQSKSSMLTMHGVGVMKYTRYGSNFLELVQNYCEKNQIKEIKKRVSSISNTAQKRVKRYIEVGESFNAGQSIESLKSHYKVTLQTIIKHLLTYFLDGYELRKSEEILTLTDRSKQHHSKVFKTFDQLSTEMLTPVFESLNQEVSYEDLHILRLYYLIDNQNIKDEKEEFN